MLEVCALCNGTIGSGDLIQWKVAVDGLIIMHYKKKIIKGRVKKETKIKDE